MRRFWIMPALLLLLVAACSPAPEPTPTTEPTDVPTETAAPTDAPTETAAPTDAPTETTAPAEETEVEAVAADQPAWLTQPVIDAQTGQPITLSDFTGKTVYVHMMATWCSNCRASQQRLRDEIQPQFGDEVVFVSLDVQTQIDAAALADYAAENNFGWQFAVTTPEFMNAVAEDMGRVTSNPPSTPHFVIYPDGSISDLQTGRSPVEDEIVLIRGSA